MHHPNIKKWSPFLQKEVRSPRMPYPAEETRSHGEHLQAVQQGHEPRCLLEGCLQPPWDRVQPRSREVSAVTRQWPLDLTESWEPGWRVRRRSEHRQVLAERRNGVSELTGHSLGHGAIDSHQGATLMRPHRPIWQSSLLRREPSPQDPVKSAGCPLCLPLRAVCQGCPSEAPPPSCRRGFPPRRWARGRAGAREPRCP